MQETLVTSQLDATGKGSKIGILQVNSVFLCFSCDVFTSNLT